MENDPEEPSLDFRPNLEATEEIQASSIGDGVAETIQHQAGLSNELADSNNTKKSISSGQVFGEYQLEHEIARGGMGIVFRARQRGLNRTVALKMILAGQFATEDDVRRFYTEAEAAARLDHPNIVPIYEVGEYEGMHYFSMKLIEGGDFGSHLQEVRGDLKKAISILEKVCRGVAHAHQRGVLHRDIKPANVLLDESFEPFVTDLGLARRVGSESDITRTGAIVGTPSYMSPEQAAGESDLTTATDVYSLGAMLYEVITGQPPFRGKTPIETLMKVIHDDPAKPSLSGATDRVLEAIALKCLAKDPQKRYASALDLADDLGRWQTGEPIAISSPSLSFITRNWIRQNFGNAIWILVVGALGGTLSGLGLWSATAQRDVARGLENVYAALPSQDPPFAVMTWYTPEWLVLPALLVFVGALTLTGFFTALLVKTKNTSADIAAGLVVGLIAATAAFFFAVGTLSVSVAMNRDDIGFLAQLANALPNETPVQLLDQYPEFADLPKSQQIALLQDKILLDRTMRVPHGLALAAIACLVMFVAAGVAETVIAGSVVREFASHWRAFGVYLFRACPYVLLSIFLGMNVAARIIFGFFGCVFDWWTLTLFAGMILAVVAQYRHWWLPLRLATAATSCGLIVAFFLFDFGLIPQLARSRAAMASKIRLAEKFPQNPRLQLTATSSILEVGVNLYTADRVSAGQRYFEQAIDYVQQSSLNPADYSTQGILSVACRNKAFSMVKLGQRDESVVWIKSVIDSHRDNPQLLASSVSFFLANDLHDEVEDLMASHQIDDVTSYRAIQRMLYQAKTFGNAEINQASAEFQTSMRVAAEALKRRLNQADLSKTVPARMKADVEALQRWSLWHLDDVQKMEELLQSLLSQSEMAGEQSDRIPTSVQAVILEPLELNLNDFFPKAGDHTSVLASATVYSDRAKTVTFALGSDDGFEMWVNGERLSGFPNSRRFSARDSVFSGQLMPGDNHIVIRITQNQGPWCFALQIDAADGWPAALKWRRR